MLRQGRSVRDESPIEAQRVAGTFAWLDGSQQRAHSLWAQGLEKAKALGARHAGARILFERSKRADRLDDLRQAAQQFAECGALGDLRQPEAMTLASSQSRAERDR